MKKISVIISLVLILALVAVGCGNGGQQSQSEQPSGAGQPEASQGGEPAEPTDPSGADVPAPAYPSLDEITTLIMGTEAGFAPYEYYDDTGAVVGVDPDIAQAIADALGKKLEIIDMEFTTIVPEIQNGRVHFGAAGMTVTEDRQKEADFSIPYATSKQIIVVRKDNTEITKPEDLNGKAVGVQLGTVADFELDENWPEVALSQYNKYFEAMSDLVNGRLDAIVMDVLPAQEFVGQNEDLMILDQELMTDEYAICVGKGNTELLEAINGVLQELIDSGKIDEFTVNHTVS